MPAKESSMNRLDSIATRQRTGRLRDLVFAAFVLLAGVASISTAAHVAHASHVEIAST